MFCGWRQRRQPGPALGHTAYTGKQRGLKLRATLEGENLSGYFPPGPGGPFPRSRPLGFPEKEGLIPYPFSSLCPQSLGGGGVRDDAGCRCQEGPPGVPGLGKSPRPSQRLSHPPHPPEPGSFILLTTSLGPLGPLPGETGPRPVCPEKSSSDYTLTVTKAGAERLSPHLAQESAERMSISQMGKARLRAMNKYFSRVTQ